MSERASKFSEELDALIYEGEMLHNAIQNECNPEEFKAIYLGLTGGNEEKFKSFVKSLPDFKSSYQAWYTKAQEVIRHIMPGRITDFISYFDIPKGRKSVSFRNYMIRDYLQGLTITSGWGEEIVVDGAAAIPEFRQQLSMVKAARDMLESTIMDLKAILQADLFDSELETAEALAKAGHLRAAGAICGVVIEKHLHHICAVHGIAVRKKNPGISDLSQLLRDADVTSVPQWRFIQHLADVRNICGHAKGREPNKDDIEDLVSGTKKILKTVF